MKGGGDKRPPCPQPLKMLTTCCICYLIETFSISRCYESTSLVLIDPGKQVRILVDGIKNFASHQKKVDVHSHDDVLRSDKRMTERKETDKLRF